MAPAVPSAYLALDSSFLVLCHVVVRDVQNPLRRLRRVIRRILVFDSICLRCDSGTAAEYSDLCGAVFRPSRWNISVVSACSVGRSHHRVACPIMIRRWLHATTLLRCRMASCQLGPWLASNYGHVVEAMHTERSWVFRGLCLDSRHAVGRMCGARRPVRATFACPLCFRVLGWDSIRVIATIVEDFHNGAVSQISPAFVMDGKRLQESRCVLSHALPFLYTLRSSRYVHST